MESEGTGTEGPISKQVSSSKCGHMGPPLVCAQTDTTENIPLPVIKMPIQLMYVGRLIVAQILFKLPHCLDTKK